MCKLRSNDLGLYCQRAARKRIRRWQCGLLSGWMTAHSSLQGPVAVKCGMAIILAIETSSELASAALLHGNEVLVRDSSGVQTHSQTLLPMVQSLLAQAGISLAQCDAIAYGAGPGSFTGVRTACGIAQGLAFGAGLPVVPIVTLLAMAEACRAATGATNVLAVMDARMGEVYWAQYRYADGWHPVVEPTLSAPSGVLPDAAAVDLVDLAACGNGFSAYARNASAELMPHAAHIAALARTAFAAGQTVIASDAQPIYLRNKIALTTAERLARAANSQKVAE
jgi:tRNA threonylcarbamoyladenosine biosynthesis protein TsaB